MSRRTCITSDIPSKFRTLMAQIDVTFISFMELTVYGCTVGSCKNANKKRRGIKNNS